MIFKYIYRIIVFLILVILIVANYRYYTGARLGYKKSVKEQLYFLRSRLQEGVDIDMQNKYPEGYVFYNALYGLTWCEYAQQAKADTGIKAIDEAEFVLKNLESEFARSGFKKDVSPEYGIFYKGWTNYVRAKILQTSGKGKNPDIESNFISACNEINSWILNNNSPYPESYPGGSWPADMMPAAASLKIHDQLYSKKYGSTLKLFLDKVKRSVDLKTGLIPHRSESTTGFAVEGARGSSQGLIIRLLAEIDTSLAVSQYEKYRQLFEDKTLQLSVIKEYPDSVSGREDADSGPVIFGAGAAATIVGLAASKSVGDSTAASWLASTIETAGFPLKLDGAKRYIFGRVPIADAFIAWAYVTPSYVNRDNNSIDHSVFSRNEFPMLSFTIIILLFLPEYIMARRQKKLNRRRGRF